MSLFDHAEVISQYPLEKAIEDGVLVEIFQGQWGALSDGKPIVATTNLFDDISLDGLTKIWNAYVHWQKYVMPTLPEADRLFHITIEDKKVRVIEDSAAITLMYPEDY